MGVVGRVDLHWSASGRHLVRLSINGETQELPDGLTVRELLSTRSLDPRYLAVELNRQVVSRANHAIIVLNDGDVVEIVTLVGGG